MAEEISDEKSAPVDREALGPFDETEVSEIRPFIDFGSIKMLPREGLNLRLEIEEGSGKVLAVALDYINSTLQVQPFSAMRSSGLWHQIRSQIAEQIKAQGGIVTEVEGPVGPELRCQIPAISEGKQVMQDARFLGVDGPKWFLRGVIAGQGARDERVGEELIKLFRGIVVVRGNAPLPPAELLPLHVPAQASGQTSSPAASPTTQRSI